MCQPNCTIVGTRDQCLSCDQEDSMTTDERMTRRETAMKKAIGVWVLEAQVGFTRVIMDVSLLRKNGVKKTVKDEMINMGAVKYLQKATSQKVWSLGLGKAGEWFYGNSIDECLTKAEKRYRKWFLKGGAA